MVLRWFPVDTLPDVLLFPDFLRTEVREMPDSQQHIVRVDIQPPTDAATPGA